MSAGDSRIRSRLTAAAASLLAGSALAFIPASAEGAEVFFAGFESEAANDYDAATSVVARGKHRKTSGHVSLSKGAMGSRRAHLGAQYRTPRATASWKGLEMDLGELGSIEMRFERRMVKVRKRLGTGCRYERARVARGTFVGRAAFEGERNYSGFERERVRGVIGKITVRGCRGNRRSETWMKSAGRLPRGLRWFFVSSAGPAVGEITEFWAAKEDNGPRLPGPPETSFGVGMARWSADDRVRVSKSVYLGAPPRTFTVAGGRATLTPPRPFAGSARVSEGSMTGDLTISFPGEEPMALTPAKAKFTGARAIASRPSSRSPMQTIAPKPTALFDLVR